MRISESDYSTVTPASVKGRLGAFAGLSKFVSGCNCGKRQNIVVLCRSAANT